LNGLSDWEMATRPQENPPYGHTAEIASRAVHSPATTTGTMPSRPSLEGQTRGPTLRTTAVRARPAAKKIDCSPARASHGTGPRYRVSQEI
jgi:hypothetical protein